MATYGYKAITKAGKEVKGSLEADNKDLAMAELRRDRKSTRLNSSHASKSRMPSSA